MRPVEGEFAFIERMRRLLPSPPVGQTWIGDDAAVLDDGVLFATDVLVEDVHFDFAWCTPEDAGWRAMAVNVSDISAMGGTPWAAVVALVVPADRPGLADGIGRGLAAAVDAFECPLVGGDVSNGPACTVAVAILGRSAAPGPVRRSGARAGDIVFVTGSLGSAAAALASLVAGGHPDADGVRRLRRPVPSVATGRAAATAGATAMIDISDGLAADLAHLCEQSRTGVLLDGPAIPLAAGATLEHALGGGDDYELCFCAADAARVAETFRAHALRLPTRIGTMTRERTRLLVAADGSTQPFPPGGWQHHVPPAT